MPSVEGTSPQEEQALVNRCIEDKPDAWRELLEKYTDAVRCAVVRWFRGVGLHVDRHMVDDYSQSVWISLLAGDRARLRRFDATKASLRKYLVMNTRQRMIDLERVKKHQRHRIEPLPHDADQLLPSPGVDLTNLEYTELVERLSEEERSYLGGRHPADWPPWKRSRVKTAILRKLEFLRQGLPLTHTDCLSADTHQPHPPQ